MRLMSARLQGLGRACAVVALLMALVPALSGSAVLMAQEPAAAAQGEHRPGGEANLILPDLGLVEVGGYDGRTLLPGQGRADSPHRRLRLSTTQVS